jgi:RloB-like protein
LIERAIALIESNEDFDAAYVVFDRDSFEDFESAMKLAYDFSFEPQPILRLIPIPSGPCFEVWLLLHFVDTDMKFVRKGSKSPAKCVESELARHFPKYEKNDPALFTKISTPERVKLAKARSERLRKNCDDLWSCTFTDVDLLVDALQSS